MELFGNVYNGQVITFDFSKDRDVMVNATEMSKLFGKQVVAFMRNKDTKSFIDECLKSENSHFLNIQKEDDLYVSRQSSGTWMHRVLALKFAAWLDPKFELWVYCMIDKILFEHYRAMEQSIKQSAKRRLQIDKIKNKLSSNDLFLQLQQLELEERQATYRRSKGSKDELTKYKNALGEEE